jgi:hypothetical protein
MAQGHLPALPDTYTDRHRHWTQIQTAIDGSDQIYCMLC